MSCGRRHPHPEPRPCERSRHGALRHLRAPPSRPTPPHVMSPRPLDTAIASTPEETLCRWLNCPSIPYCLVHGSTKPRPHSMLCPNSPPSIKSPNTSATPGGWHAPCSARRQVVAMPPSPPCGRSASCSITGLALPSPPRRCRGPPRSPMWPTAPLSKNCCGPLATATWHCVRSCSPTAHR